MACIGDIKCSSCETVFRGLIGRDEKCPSCLYASDDSHEQTIETINRLKAQLTTCSCGCGEKGMNVIFFNGYGFVDFNHFHSWYKKVTGSEGFPRVPFITHEDNFLFLVGATVEPFTIDDLVEHAEPYL